METLNSLCLVKSCKALPCIEKHPDLYYHYCVSFPCVKDTKQNEHVIGGDTPCYLCLVLAAFNQLELKPPDSRSRKRRRLHLRPEV